MRGDSMSSNNVPSKREIHGWAPDSLAEYMRRLKLSGCDRVVTKGSITGAQFMKMTEYDLQVFPSRYIPIITQIHGEISKGKKRRTFSLKSKAQQHHKQVLVHEEELWGSDEFDSESDPDAEGWPQEGEGDGYMCSVSQPQAAADQPDREQDYLVPDPVTPPPPPRVDNLRRIMTGDPVPDPPLASGWSSKKPPLPPQPRIKQTPQTHVRPTASSRPSLGIDRSKKPAPPGPSQKDLNLNIKKSKGSSAKASGSTTSKPPLQTSYKPTDVDNCARKLVPARPVPTQPARCNTSVPGQGLDPIWYGGQMSRHQAEVALREVNKDGAFVVRDSSQGSVEHPYTLMLLKEDKIYNIKIRNQGHSYSLGNSLNNAKSFPGVEEMISLHTHTPLLLIDASNQSCEEHSQSCLLHPAGL